MADKISASDACGLLDSEFWNRARYLAPRDEALREDIVQEMALAVLEAGHKEQLTLDEYRKVANSRSHAYAKAFTGQFRKRKVEHVGGIEDVERIARTEGNS